jgi:hypothetical protein
MTAMHARTAEFDLFGPWIDVVETPDQVPPLYRDHPLDLDASRLVLKLPRNIARRDANPDMDLYDHLVVVDDTTFTLLSRRTAARAERGYDTVQVRLDEIVAVRDAVSILDGAITVTTRPAQTVTVPYKGSSRDNVRLLVELLRGAAVTTGPTHRGEALLHAGRAAADPKVLDLGRDEQSLVSYVREIGRSHPELETWVGHARADVRRRSSGPMALVHAVVRAFSPATLHGAVLAADDRTLEVYGRHGWVLRGRAPVMSSSRLIVPLGLLDSIDIAPDPKYRDSILVTFGLGAARVDIVLPEGSAAHRLLESARG